MQICMHTRAYACFSPSGNNSIPIVVVTQNMPLLTLEVMWTGEKSAKVDRANVC